MISMSRSLSARRYLLMIMYRNYASEINGQNPGPVIAIVTTARVAAAETRLTLRKPFLGKIIHH
jgi:hypothetical protein